MSANATTAAPTGRKKIAQGKTRSDAALGHDSPNTSSPEGAKEKPLAELVQPRREKAIPAEHPDSSYIGLEHIEAHTTKLLGSVPATEMKSTANRFCTGDVLYSRLRPYLNKVWHADRDGLCSSEFIVLPGNDSVDANFLRYRLNSRDFVSFANSLNAGDRPRVDFDQISSFCILPFSLLQQRRIVAEIEKQFTRLEAGVKHVKSGKFMAQQFDSKNVHEATRQYETWLAAHVRVVKSDLDAKHKLMAQDVFSFLRATFYRWMQLFSVLCPKLASAPRLLAVGDLHVENYGTWRDAEGRLVWGINDFDEAFPLPYTIDLVRLATSAWLAIELGHLPLAPADACAAILAGYTKGLADGGEPFVLAEKRPLLRKAVTSSERDPVLFWEKFSALPTIKPVPAKVMLMLKQAMPERGLAFRVAHRRAGLGSLGRQRFTAIADWRGGMIAREAKALLPSACAWAAGLPNREIYYSRLISIAVCTPDPFLAVHAGWVLRRLSPYCSRIELSQLPRSHDREKMLRDMGKELANVHLGSRRAVPAVRRDLAERKSNWLHRSAEVMVQATLKDWREWRK